MNVPYVDLSQAHFCQVDYFQREGELIKASPHQKPTPEEPTIVEIYLDATKLIKVRTSVSLMVHVPSSTPSPLAEKNICKMESDTFNVRQVLQTIVGTGNPPMISRDKIVFINLKLASSIHQVVMNQFQLSLEAVLQLEYQFVVDFTLPSLKEKSSPLSHDDLQWLFEKCGIKDPSEVNSKNKELDDLVKYNPDNRVRCMTNKFKILPRLTANDVVNNRKMALGALDTSYTRIVH